MHLQDLWIRIVVEMRLKSLLFEKLIDNFTRYYIIPINLLFFFFLEKNSLVFLAIPGISFTCMIRLLSLVNTYGHY